MDRTILHCDCNAYYASVETIFRPELNDVPMAVCGDPEGRHGIILAKNELAKKYGIVTAETVWKAKRKCPQLVLVPPHREWYAEYNKRINEIYQQYTDQVEAFSIDESWLDVTGSIHLFGDGKTIADTLRKRIREELGLTISVGVSFNKLFAKMGSDYKKPDATTVITRENYQQLLYPLPVEAIMFIGKTAGQLLRKHQITTIGELAQSSRSRLGQLLGKGGESVWDQMHGLDDSPVHRPWDEGLPKSISNSITFPRNLIGLEDIKAGLLMLCESVGRRLRSHCLWGQTVAIQIKNPALQVISRQMQLTAPTQSTKVIYQTALAILEKSWNVDAPIRLLSVAVTHICDKETGISQMTLFTEEEARQEKQNKLENAIDAIKNRFGSEAVSTGRVLSSTIFQGSNEEDEGQP